LSICEATPIAVDFGRAHALNQRFANGPKYHSAPAASIVKVVITLPDHKDNESYQVRDFLSRPARGMHQTLEYRGNLACSTVENRGWTSLHPLDDNNPPALNEDWLHVSCKNVD
jgi:hypothetical protein